MKKDHNYTKATADKGWYDKKKIIIIPGLQQTRDGTIKNKYHNYTKAMDRTMTKVYNYTN